MLLKIESCVIIVMIIFFALISTFETGNSKKDTINFSRLKENREAERSRLFLVTYDGTQEELKEFAKTNGFELKRKVVGNIYQLKDLSATSRGKSLEDTIIVREQLRTLDKHLIELVQDRTNRRVTKSSLPRTKRYTLDDAFFSEQWYMDDTDPLSYNTEAAWQAGFTGQGIVIGFVDDGLESAHTDLNANVLVALGYDVIYDAPDPSHVWIGEDHGTMCAGVVGAVDNTECIIGIAYNAKIVGIRLLDSFIDALDSEEAIALNHALDTIDIYSNSWGPTDNGEVWALLGSVQRAALVEGVTNGRGGRGAIYTWASGNGGINDDCNADGYANSRFTIAVMSLDRNGAKPPYTEFCSAALCAAYGGGIADRIATTGLNNTCSDQFLGTSAATPAATGIIALALEVNPRLTWRDVQHLIVETANSAGLDWSDHDFVTNGAGKNVSTTAGFGLLNAHAMVEKAKSWTLVTDYITCQTAVKSVFTTFQGSLTDSVQVAGCEINYIEHVEVSAKIQASLYNGDMELYLTSPTATSATRIMSARYYDTSQTIIEHMFVSVHQWGEPSEGTWSLELRDAVGDNDMTFYEWTMTIYGTVADPAARNQTIDETPVNVGVIVGAVVGAVAGVAVVAVGVVVILKVVAGSTAAATAVGPTAATTWASGKGGAADAVKNARFHKPATNGHGNGYSNKALTVQDL